MAARVAELEKRLDDKEAAAADAGQDRVTKLPVRTRG